MTSYFSITVALRGHGRYGTTWMKASEILMNPVYQQLQTFYTIIKLPRSSGKDKFLYPLWNELAPWFSPPACVFIDRKLQAVTFRQVATPHKHFQCQSRDEALVITLQLSQYETGCFDPLKLLFSLSKEGNPV